MGLFKVCVFVTMLTVFQKLCSRWGKYLNVNIFYLAFHIAVHYFLLFVEKS